MNKSIYHKIMDNSIKSLIILVFIVLLFIGLPHTKLTTRSLAASRIEPQDVQYTAFEGYLDAIRQELKIPGMSAAIVHNQELAWASGLGYADLENQVAATADTPYGLASVTKPIGAVIIMQLVEKGLVDLDAPVTQYGVNLEDKNVTVRHLLTHTSEGVLGMEHHYNGSRYGYLGGVIETASGKTFAALLSESILLPLGMKNTALNPFNSWGYQSHYFLEDLKMGLGWGENYQNYLSVYDRLAKPYQLDEASRILPGMYQTYSNPAAGLLSSVTDLAKFDIAIDRGLLLGNTAKTEMFSPAISTYPNRPDLNYGLGWYVQDFEGLRLLWHTGRWEPSTSALYLKIPEKNLTFIVLANTDNLTVPFAGVGNGDVSKSALVLAFFRYFIFPEQYGSNLPRIDWSANQEILSKQLLNVEDISAQAFLERELWSFRQVYASTGQLDQAELLERLSLRIYPDSEFRTDWMFTQTSGQRIVIPPATSASAFIWLNRGAILWFTLVIISILWMVIRLQRSVGFTRWGKFLWLLSAIILGPVAILIHANLQLKTVVVNQANWRQAWGTTALSTTGYAIAWSLAIAILIMMGDEAHPLATLGLTYLLPITLGVIFVRTPLLMSQLKDDILRIARRSLLVETVLFNLGFAAFFPLSMLISERLLGKFPHPTSVFFLPMISFIAIVSTIISTPLQRWMMNHGYNLPTGLASAKTDRGPIKKLGTPWYALLGTFIAMVVALVVTIGFLG